MYTLNNLVEDSFVRKGKKRVGRGRGSKVGKTSGRGHKGRGSRSGSGEKMGHEGGRKPLYLTLPIKGRTKRKAKRDIKIISLANVMKHFSEKEVVNHEELKKQRFISFVENKFKVLKDDSDVDFTKTKIKRVIANGFSSSAKEILEKNGIEVSVVV